MQVLHDDVSVREELQKLESKADEWRGFLLAVGTAYEGHLHSPVAECRFVDSEALLFPVIRFGNTVTNGSLEKVRRVLIVNRLAGVASIIEHALRIDMVGHSGGRRVESQELAS